MSNPAAAEPGRAIGLAELRDLAVIPLWTRDSSRPSVAGLFGIGRSHAYQLARQGTLPTIRLGSRVVVPVPALLRMLGATTEVAPPAEVAP